ncbi:hypothetical protein JS528_10655 [Bifidobacterium sp. MA2]|uniref:Uncharacterized protein n=1 Tax=Bifidobacterium santillanense TaxID=2809028 RepID=A0ABS5US77_9BIFI|nr:hypothetical protein [Bifidobacterium santillanense]MBT1173785.1 hypothetical protein [Bifidobacterium santillanense]
MPMHGDDSEDRPRYGHMLGGHLALDTIVSFPISLLAAWLGLRLIAHAAFDAGELAASLAITWLGVSLIDSRLDYELQRATNRTAPPMPRPMVAVKMALPFALPWLAAIWHADMTTVAAASVAAGAIRLVEIIGLERPWRGEDQETIDRRRRELQRITRETAKEIREERQPRTDAYDPYNLRGKH